MNTIHLVQSQDQPTTLKKLDKPSSKVKIVGKMMYMAV